MHTLFKCLTVAALVSTVTLAQETIIPYGYNVAIGFANPTNPTSPFCRLASNDTSLSVFLNCTNTSIINVTEQWKFIKSDATDATKDLQFNIRDRTKSASLFYDAANTKLGLVVNEALTDADGSTEAGYVFDATTTGVRKTV